MQCRTHSLQWCYQFPCHTLLSPTFQGYCITVWNLNVSPPLNPVLLLLLMATCHLLWGFTHKGSSQNLASTSESQLWNFYPITSSYLLIFRYYLLFFPWQISVLKRNFLGFLHSPNDSNFITGNMHMTRDKDFFPYRLQKLQKRYKSQFSVFTVCI